MVAIIFPVIFLTGVTSVVCLDETSTILHSTGLLLCKHNVSAEEFHRVKWFKSRQDDIFEHGDPAVVSWDGSSPPYTSGNCDIDKDFSLVIYNISIPDEGLYRCQITKANTSDSFRYDVKLIIFSLPLKAPLIQRVNQTFIICSVDRVYPLHYPHLEFEHEEYAVSNTDGTYNTSVSGSVQTIPSESKVVSCSFPHFNYSETSSLSLYPTTTPCGNDDEQYPTTHSVSPSPESPNQREKGSSNVWLIPVAAAAAVITCLIIGILIILWRKYTKRSHSYTKSTSAERNDMQLYTKILGGTPGSKE